MRRSAGAAGGRIDRRNDGPIAVLTIDRPALRNAIDYAMWVALGEQLDRLASEAATGTVRAVVIRGAGGEAFSSGSDLREFERMSIPQVRHCFLTMEETISRVERLPLPVIACLNGYALGSAFELACACDIQVASDTAMMGMPVARLGIMLSPEFAKRLVATLGPNRTKDLLFTGRMLTAQQALDAGLVNYVVPGGVLEEFTRQLALGIASQSPHAVAAAKDAVFRAVAPPVPDPAADPPYFIHEADFREGVRAFLEKRAPRFGGRGRGEAR